jgi:hypothetical protein
LKNHYDPFVAAIWMASKYISIYIHGPRPGAFGLRDSPMPDSGSPQASLFGAVSKDGS